ncbi:MAG: polyphenol oxidase family protein [Desulfobacteraceae bacterium]|jgi:hypothetical protein
MLVKIAPISATLDDSVSSFETNLPNEVPYFQFPELSQYDRLTHAVFTRRGGVSESPFGTLNTSLSNGDKAHRVRTNLKIVQEAIGAKHLKSMNQAHGKDIFVLRRDPSQALDKPANADAIITDLTNVALMVKQADCQAVILFDPAKGVISNVHCGWRGNTYDFLGTVVMRLKVDFGCNPSDLRAAIGPSLGPCCAEFITHEQIFPDAFRRFMVRKNYFDLWRISRWQLMEAGLKKAHIELAGICTRCRTDLFFSYRAEGVTGRFATVLMLE